MRVLQTGSPAGSIDATLPPMNLEGVEPVMGDVPGVGTHTNAILRELGFSDDRVAALRAEGAV